MRHLTILFSLLIITFTTIAHAQIPFAQLQQQDGTPTLAPMLEQVTPAVVNISVAGTRVTRQRIPDAFRYFFGPHEQVREQPFQGLGSGVIINAKQGYVVTNNHVVESASDITVTLTDGRTFTASVLGADPDADIALLQLSNPSNLTEIALADSDKLRVGDFAIAIGNPFGLGQTVTSGIVSALGRGGFGIDRLENFIQTDAAINRGNSGGALVNLKGQLIGINTAILGATGNIGIGFAIPSNMMNSLVEQILEFGEVRRGILGVRGRDLDQQLADALDIKRTQGAWVSEVTEGSAAQTAGIQAGDVIISINGTPILSMPELAAKVGAAGAGRTIRLGVIRDGKELTIKVKLAEAEQAVTAESLHPALRGAALQPNNKNGLRITEIDAKSPAEQIGLEKDDIILAVNRQPVNTVTELRSLLEQSKNVTALTVLRGHRQLFLLLPQP